LTDRFRGGDLVEESKEQRPESAQDIPEPSGMETTGTEPAQEQPATSELLSAEAPPPRQATAGSQSNLLVISAAAAIVAFAAVGIFVLGMFTHAMVESDDGGGGTAAQVAAGDAAGGGAVQPTAGPVDVSVDDDPGRGPEDAAVTIVEFSDFQCPYCARFQEETLPQILSNYGDQVRFVYRDFPLTSLHANALKAAEASECADDQGKYWEYHDLLFQNQTALDDESLKGYAASLELDTTAFDDCLASGKYTQEVAKDLQDGTEAGVQGTPSFFINGTPIRGAQPYQAFQAAIEAALAEAGD
jgi:protein-disulfide isomerase